MLSSFGGARVATLGTVAVDAQPHLVPVTFALSGEIVVIAIDHKPKSTQNLKRIRNIGSNDRVSLLVHEYDDHDWSSLWWVRVDGHARIKDSGEWRDRGLGWLAEKYAQYRDHHPAGPVILVDIAAVRGWSYSGSWDPST
jgi:PPOX class probable F420-dependent enzyme